MSRHKFYLQPALLLVAVALQLAVSDIARAQELQNAIRQQVVAQSLAEMAVRSRATPGPVDERLIRIERVSSAVDSLELWRATLPSDHSHPYLLAHVGDKLFQLGGFTNPQLVEVAGGLGGEVIPRATLARAQRLAVLADPNGAIQIISSDNADRPGYASKVLETWKRIQPKDWPRDTLILSGGGRLLIRLTLFSRDTRSYTLYWVPLAYSFAFDENGRLDAWAVRTGEDFNVSGVPLPAMH